MNKKIIGIILLIAGIIVAVVSLTADIIGISGDPLNFGWKQILGTSGGIVVLMVGLWFLQAKKK